MDMEICTSCEFKFPAGIVKLLALGPREVRTVCPVCALALLRNYHNAPDFMFEGESNVKAFEIARKIIESQKGKDDSKSK